MKVTGVENLSTGGGTYRLHFEAEPGLFATLFAQFENGAGLFMADRLRRGDHRLAGRWFIVNPDGEVIEPSKTATFTLRGKTDATKD